MKQEQERKETGVPAQAQSVLGRNHLSVLVLVERQHVGAVLVVVDAVFPLLAEFEVLAESSLHHHVLTARADSSDVPLCVHH